MAEKIKLARIKGGIVKQVFVDDVPNMNSFITFKGDEMLSVKRNATGMMLIGTSEVDIAKLEIYDYGVLIPTPPTLAEVIIILTDWFGVKNTIESVVSIVDSSAEVGKDVETTLNRPFKVFIIEEGAQWIVGTLINSATEMKHHLIGQMVSVENFKSVKSCSAAYQPKFTS